MQIPKEAWKKNIGEGFLSQGQCKVTGSEGGLPNIDDGCFQGIPLGGFGAGVISQNYRGDFSLWQLEVGKHKYFSEPCCQFGIYEDGKAFILNENKPQNVLSAWEFKKQNGKYSALYPTAYFEYEDLGIIQKQFSPIIPNNYVETSYPLAVFKWEITNSKSEDRTLSLLWTFKSPFKTNENFYYQENAYSGIVFDSLNKENNSYSGQLGIFAQKEDLELTYLTSFNPNGDGSDLWKSFSEKGMLLISDDKDTANKPAAISAKITIPPNSKKTITFVLVWDFPVCEFGDGTRWFKKYTQYFGKDGRNITKIARKAFGENEKWELEIDRFHKNIISNFSDFPSWFHTLLINEIYYLAAGGTFWTIGKVPKTGNILRQEEHFGVLECFDYPFYETLDVRFYGSFPLLKLWSDLEKLILKDYVKSISIQDDEEKKFDHPLASSTGIRKVKGSCPHDLGMPSESPFIKYNSYPHVDISKWKDLNSKFILQIYRYFYFYNDLDFLKYSWESVELAINYLKQFDRDNDGLIENENIPDQTYDNWKLSGPGGYCNGLWLASLLAVIKMAQVLNNDSVKYLEWFKLGKENLNKKLWNGNFFLLDTQSQNSNTLMADVLCGQWYADLLSLGDVFDSKKVDLTLKNIYKLNVLNVKNGRCGAINGILFDGSFLPPSEVWKQNTQWNEIWTGSTLALSSHMYLRNMKEESLKTVEGIYLTSFVEKGYVFRMPEAWDVDGNFRASMYHRPGAIWAFPC